MFFKVIAVLTVTLEKIKTPKRNHPLSHRDIVEMIMKLIFLHVNWNLLFGKMNELKSSVTSWISFLISISVKQVLKRSGFFYTASLQQLGSVS